MSNTAPRVKLGATTAATPLAVLILSISAMFSCDSPVVPMTTRMPACSAVRAAAMLASARLKSTSTAAMRPESTRCKSAPSGSEEPFSRGRLSPFAALSTPATTFMSGSRDMLAITSRPILPSAPCTITFIFPVVMSGGPPSRQRETMSNRKYAGSELRLDRGAGAYFECHWLRYKTLGSPPPTTLERAIGWTGRHWRPTGFRGRRVADASARDLGYVTEDRLAGQVYPPQPVYFDDLNHNLVAKLHHILHGGYAVVGQFADV